MTFTLLTTSEGKKMGKTMGGAVWLDPEKTTPYEFYQYWRNIDDPDVENCLGLLTFLPMDEVRRLGSLKDAEINKAKEVLAYEVTKIVHGEAEATKAQEAARALFSGGANSGSIPTTEIPLSEFADGIDVITLLQKCDLIPSRAEGRRLIQQNGVKINEQTITTIEQKITQADFKEGIIAIQKGKKIFHHVKSI
jgi:tyrosyl-tRNA synthetase